MRRLWFRSVVALALLVGALTGPQVIDRPTAYADSHTVSQDSLRTGWDPAEPGLSPSAVTGSDFGQLFATRVTGQVYAQPLVIGDTVVASTEDDWVYGLDAATGTVKWSRDFGPPWPASTVGCGDLLPNLGNTSTGVYDPATNAVYLTTKVNDGPDPEHPNWYLHAVNPGTGAERAGWPVKIVGTPANDPDRPFLATDVNQRPGLLLMNGAVYLAFGAQCDIGSYVGWVAGVNTSTRAIAMWSDEAGLSNEGAGIWHAGGGIVSDGPGRMFVTTGNGVTPPKGPGKPVPQQLSESVVRLGVDSKGVISSQDFFAPWNADELDSWDADLGSGGPAALPDQYFGTSAYPHLMVQMGKEGRLYLLNRDRLGGRSQGAGGKDDVLQNLGPFNGVWGHPAAYGGQGGYLYFVQDGGGMLAFKYSTTGQGKPALARAGNTAEDFGYTSGSPIVTSDGTQAGSAVVWVVNVDGADGANGRLCAYDAVPSNEGITLLRCFAIGTGAKFTTAAASNGRIYVGTRDGYVYGFGRPTTSALITTHTSFGNVDVGDTGAATVTATATRRVTVTGVSAGAPFAAEPPDLPVTLETGDTIDVPATFSPTAPGSATGALTFAVRDGPTSVTIAAGLQGNGIRAGLTPAPAKLDFGQVPIGATRSLTVSFTNTGATDETVRAVTAPSEPFTATGLPAEGAVVAAGQSIAVSVAYTPTEDGDHAASIALEGDHGQISVPLSGTGVSGRAELSISPSDLHFGSVPLGLSATQTLTVSNTGNLTLTITKAAPPALPFVVDTPLPEGQTLGPGDSVQVKVTFAPTTATSYENAYVISSNDGAGAHAVPVTGTGVKRGSGTPVPSVGSGGWVFNGSAKMSGSKLMLTPATNKQAGSAVFSAPVPGEGIKASFTAQLGGGNGGEGMTFALLDASANTAKSLGTGGGGLGFYGLPGIAVTLDTLKAGHDPSSNFVGLTAGGTGGSLTYLATATDVPKLRSGTHKVDVTAAGGRVTVAVDGDRVIDAEADVPASVLPAFTGSTGTKNDEHVVVKASIASGTTALPQPGTGWRFNGSAAMNGADVVLTPAEPARAGSVFYTAPIKTDGLTASFTVTIGGGTGAHGQTFALLDPKSAASGVGSAGTGLGFGGLKGVAVAFGTRPQSGADFDNWVGIAASADGGKLKFSAVNGDIPDLRGGSHNVVVDVKGTTVTVSIDGTQVLRKAVSSLKDTAVVGYTGATGDDTDVHKVSAAQIISGVATKAPPIGRFRREAGRYELSASGMGGKP